MVGAREGWEWERAGVALPGRVAWQGNLRYTSH